MTEPGQPTHPPTEKVHKKLRAPRFKTERMVALIVLLLFLSWVIFLNRPRGEFEATKLDASSPAVINPIAVSDADADIKRSFNVGVVYSRGYLIDLGGLERVHPFDIKKYQKIHNQLVADDLLSEEGTYKPEELTDEQLLLVHTEEYLENLKSRSNIAEYLEAPLLKVVPVSLDTAVLKPFKRASGGTILAARLALRGGIGINIGGGYHHAKPDRGEGFCLFADVPIAIRQLQQEKKIKRAVIIDVDVHQGNGTILCLGDDDQTFTFSMHQGTVYPNPKEKGDLDVDLPHGMRDEDYLAMLHKHLDDVLDRADADICFIVGGCDTLEGDPLASLAMSHAGIVLRDNKIVKACVDRNLPVVLTLSGGYSKDAWKSQYESIKSLIETYGLGPGPQAAGKKLETQRRSDR